MSFWSRKLCNMNIQTLFRAQQKLVFQQYTCISIINLTLWKMWHNMFKSLENYVWIPSNFFFFLTAELFYQNLWKITTVEPLYNEVLGTMKITLLYQVSHYIRVKKQRNIKSWDQQNYLVIRGFCYIRPRFSEVPLYHQYILHCISWWSAVAIPLH